MPPCTIGKSAWSWRESSAAPQSRDLGGAARQPAQAALARVARGGLVALAGNDVVELHDHVGAEVALDPHHGFGRERAPRSVDVAAELDAVLDDRAQRLQGEHLKAAGVGEDRTVPAHERVQAAQLAHDVVAGAQVQMVGVGEDHLRAERAEIVGVERLDGGERADGHERRRLHAAVRRGEDAGARAPSWCSTVKLKADKVVNVGGAIGWIDAR